jgi:hypothetical protein
VWPVIEACCATQLHGLLSACWPHPTPLMGSKPPGQIRFRLNLNLVANIPPILIGVSTAVMTPYLAWMRHWQEAGTRYGEQRSGSASHQRRRMWVRFKQM